ALASRVAPEKAEQPGQPTRIGRWAMRIARILVYAAAAWGVLRIWGFEFQDLREGIVGQIIGVAIRIAIILFLAFAAIELTHLGIGRLFDRAARRARNARRASQVRTLGPLL